MKIKRQVRISLRNICEHLNSQKLLPILHTRVTTPPVDTALELDMAKWPRQEATQFVYQRTHPRSTRARTHTLSLTHTQTRTHLDSFPVPKIHPVGHEDEAQSKEEQLLLCRLLVWACVCTYVSMSAPLWAYTLWSEPP